jgi:DNA polymerase-3 subunit alpha
MWDLEDLDGVVRCIIWPEQFAEFGHMVKADAILAVKAAIDRRPGAEEINLIVGELIPLEELSTRFTSGVLIRVREDVHGLDVLAPLREIVRGYPGNKPLRLRLELADGGSVSLECNGGVMLDSELRRRIDELLGPGNFKTIGNGAKSAPPPAANGRRRAMARS